MKVRTRVPKAELAKSKHAHAEIRLPDETAIGNKNAYLGLSIKVEEISVSLISILARASTTASCLVAIFQIRLLAAAKSRDIEHALVTFLFGQTQ